MNSELKARYKVLGSEKEHTKSETLTETLIEVIVNGDVKPGHKISEPELAKKYQVSRGPLREALMRLEGLGLIERIPHVGARVTTFFSGKADRTLCRSRSIGRHGSKVSCATHYARRALKLGNAIVDTFQAYRPNGRRVLLPSTW